MGMKVTIAAMCVLLPDSVGLPTGLRGRASERGRAPMIRRVGGGSGLMANKSTRIDCGPEGRHRGEAMETAGGSRETAGNRVWPPPRSNLVTDSGGPGGRRW